MAFNFFEFGMANGAIQLPNEKIRDMQQAAITANWDATTAKYTIQEQDDYGTKTYHDIEVWIDYATEMTTRGSANGDDFRRILFESIDHPVKKGLYYQFDDNTWMTYFTDKYSSLDVDIGIRRCNNVLKMIDPENGSVFCIPCIVDYDMTAPSMQVASAILTPNNHAIVKVQGNADTHRLFKMNTRFILGGRPFKLLAYQNALIDKELSGKATLLELDLFLDEIHAKDDVENQIAYNGSFNYSVNIDSYDMFLTKGSVGILNASILLNGEEVNRKVIWNSDNPETVFINEFGEYEVVGDVGQKAKISATLDGNELIAASTVIEIVATEDIKPKIIIDPFFDKVHEYETIDFDIKANYGGMEYAPDELYVSLDKDKEILSDNYLAVNRLGVHYQITGNAISKSQRILYIKVTNKEPYFVAEYNLPIRVVSFMD